MYQKSPQARLHGRRQQAHEEQLLWWTDDFDETYFLTVILKMKKH